MKKIIYIISFYYFFTSCSLTNKVSAIKETDLYRIIKIENKDDIYLINAIRNDSIFEIISLKNNNDIINKINKIKEGGEYKLQLVKIHPPKNFASFNEVNYFSYKGFNIKLNRRNHKSVYYVSNMNGLFIK